MLIACWLACAAPPDGGARPPREPTEETVPRDPPVLPEPITEPTTPTEPTTEEDPGAWLFDRPGLRRIALTIDDVALESLRGSPRDWVPATLEVDGVVVEDVGVRLKGNGSFRPVDDKPAWRIKIDQWVEGATLDGIDDLAVNNAVSDPTGLNERLAYRVYQEMGLAAPRAASAAVSVNGEPYGVYALVEHQDRRFLKRWYADADGPFYKLFDVDFEPSLVYQFDHQSGPDDRAALMGLALAIEPPRSRLSVDGQPFLDVEQFARFYAVGAVIAQTDGYPYSLPGDDAFVYVDPADGRIVWHPHGCDETFTDNDRPVDYVFGRVALRCLTDPDCEALWASAVWETVDRLESMALEAQVDAWWAEIGDEVLADPRSPYTIPQILEGVDNLRDFIRHRGARLERMPGLPSR